MANKIILKFVDSDAKTLNLNIQSAAVKPSAQVTEANIKTVMETLIAKGWGKDVKDEVKTAQIISGASYVTTTKQEVLTSQETPQE